MRTSVKRIAVSALVPLLLFVTACSLPIPHQPQETKYAKQELTPSEQIAGEVMAYLMEVVLGRAGPLENRSAWATRGQDLPLDFDMVVKRMFGPVPLRSELMVLDTNILGLTRVLYHYDRRMNLFKGMRDNDSLYPCAELMAIRLLLLHKIHRKEKVSMAGITRHIELFAAESRDAGNAELAAMQLTKTEFRYLKAIFQSEPAFYHYLRHPFIISAFKRIGVVEQDPFSLSADSSATYSKLSCKPIGPGTKGRITVAILPGMNPMFTVKPEDGQLHPTKDYLSLQEKVKTGILQKLDSIPGRKQDAVPLNFFTPNRPIAITPADSDRVIGQLCPNADFTVILMGKNVYRSIFINPDTDTLPHKSCIYLDADDVRYQMVDEEIDTVVHYIVGCKTNRQS